MACWDFAWNLFVLRAWHALMDERETLICDCVICDCYEVQKYVLKCQFGITDVEKGC